jgi:hypothetical protein
MTFLPIVDRELRVAARRKSTYRIRRWTATIAIVIAGSYLLLFWAFTRGDLGGQMFTILTTCAFGLCAIAGVFITSDCLSEEKREGTLGLLFLTDLKGYDVVLGKFIANSVNAIYGLLGIFPVLALPLLLGGVTGAEFWRMMLALVNMLFFSLTLGMCVSALSRNNQSAMGVTLAALVVAVAVLPWMESLRSAAAMPELYVTRMSPSYAFAFARENMFWARPERFWISLALSHAAGWIFLIIASVALPRVWQETTSQLPFVRRIEGWGRQDNSWWLRRFGGRAALLRLNPVLWLVLRQAGRPWLIWAIVGAWLVAILALTASNKFLSGLWDIEYSAARGFGFALKFLFAIQACRFLVEARRNGALELLLCTPLRSADLVRGQWLALKRLFLWPLVVFLAIGLAPAVWRLQTLMIAGNTPPAWDGLFNLGMYGYYALKTAADLYALGWVGMWFALSMKKPALATGATVLVVLVLPTIAFCIPDVLIALVLGGWASGRLTTDFRRFASPDISPVAAPPFRAGAPPVIGCAR